MSGDLKARIAKWKKGQTAGISPSTVTLLNDCLARIEDLEWSNKLFRDRLKELDTCHPDYGVSLEAAKKRIVELERENQLGRAELAAIRHTIVVTVGGVDYEGFPTSEINWLQRLRILVQKEADLEAAEETIRTMCGASKLSYLSELKYAYFQAK